MKRRDFFKIGLCLVALPLVAKLKQVPVPVPAPVKTKPRYLQAELIISGANEKEYNGTWVKIKGLDENFNAVEENLFIEGTGITTSEHIYRRIF